MKKGLPVKRLMLTLGVILLSRLIYFLPLPGLNAAEGIRFFYEDLVSRGGGLPDLLVLCHVGRLRSVSMFSLGLLPFLNACVAAQIITFLLPGFNRPAKSVCNRLMLFVLTLTVLFSGLQALAVSRELRLIEQLAGLKLILTSGWFEPTAAIALSAGALFLVLLSEVINRFGIGNGAGVLLSSEVLVRMGIGLRQLIIFSKGADSERAILFYGVIAGFLALVALVTRYRRRVELVRPDGGRFNINAQPFWVGVWPVLIAEFLFTRIRLVLSLGTFLGMVGIIFLCILFYQKIVCQPRRFYDLMLTYKCRPVSGKTFEHKLHQSALICALACLPVLVAVYFFPLVLPLSLNVPFVSTGMFGSFGIIILVGLAYDLKNQLSFFQKEGEENVLLRVEIEEAAAKIKCQFLNSKNISCRLRSSHFFWGLPINTVASRYYLSVPREQASQAGLLLEERESERREMSV